MKFNEAHIRQLQADGKIKGYQVTSTGKRPKEKNVGKQATQSANRPSKAKSWLSWNLMYWANEHALELKEEHKFHPERKWRFDWAFPAVKIAVEYEGIFSEKSRHTNMKGYSGDVVKYNTAVADGWRIIRATAMDYRQVPGKLNQLINQKTLT